MLRKRWQEGKLDRQQARRDRLRAGSLNCFLRGKNDHGGEICAAWRLEDAGWSRVDCVLDSGAADSVCPRSMAPHFAIEDTEASRAGVYYTSADGGRIANVGQQNLPVALENGVRTIATFQVADVSRPLMSVGKVCEMGNRVLFGAGGGYIYSTLLPATPPHFTSATELTYSQCGYRPWVKPARVFAGRSSSCDNLE